MLRVIHDVDIDVESSQRYQEALSNNYMRTCPLLKLILTRSKHEGAVLHPAVHHRQPGEHGEGGEGEEPVGEGGPGEGTGDLTAPVTRVTSHACVPWNDLRVDDGMCEQRQEAQGQPPPVKEALPDDEEDGDHLEADQGPEPRAGHAVEAHGDEIEDEPGPHQHRGQVVEQEVGGQPLAVPGQDRGGHREPHHHVDTGAAPPHD